MAVAFDTDALDLRERMDAVVSVFQDVSAPAHVAREQRDVDPRVRMDLWDLGDVELFRGEMGGIRLRRTMTQIARAPAGVLAIALQEAGTGRHEQRDIQRVLNRGDLLITHLDSPYDHLFTGHGACQVLHIGVEQLDLPFELVYRVAVDPRISPLARTMAQHITDTAAASTGSARSPQPNSALPQSNSLVRCFSPRPATNAPVATRSRQFCQLASIPISSNI
ncbi:hypothetical protein JGU71_24030 [Antrihabitans sp. YC3-6]|uniref:Transcription regulator HTH AraC- type ligand binding domain-containing protein n=1 Tax=Antrihabitans stalagmiti TaxID=2799499 RepID=A0A934NVL5_9NOCA|nr:hypothetical protein [Antrihabitans stalagmiti]MBJ8341960.1 hypothetical protein [Antrihabitans stalagmiti]